MGRKSEAEAFLERNQFLQPMFSHGLVLVSDSSQLMPHTTLSIVGVSIPQISHHHGPFHVFDTRRSAINRVSRLCQCGTCP